MKLAQKIIEANLNEESKASKAQAFCNDNIEQPQDAKDILDGIAQYFVKQYFNNRKDSSEAEQLFDKIKKLI